MNARFTRSRQERPRSCKSLCVEETSREAFGIHTSRGLRLCILAGGARPHFAIRVVDPALLAGGDPHFGRGGQPLHASPCKLWSRPHSLKSEVWRCWAPHQSAEGRRQAGTAPQFERLNVDGRCPPEGGAGAPSLCGSREPPWRAPLETRVGSLPTLRDQLGSSTGPGKACSGSGREDRKHDWRLKEASQPQPQPRDDGNSGALSRECIWIFDGPAQRCT